MARKRAAPAEDQESEDEASTTVRKAKRQATVANTQHDKTSSNISGGRGGGRGARAAYEQELGRAANDDLEDGAEAEQAPEKSFLGRRVPFEAGQIRSIYVENFMCHRKFTQQFYPGLNFIIGKNGSGKSAVAAAIQLCLGATARNTGRGTNLSNLVREGSTSPAIIRVTLLNSGPDAYKPELYGDRIVVERKIARGTGVGGYSLKSNSGEEISSQKEELEKILRIFNIFVDNPCCVLTQDESKKFINGRDEDKYKFFLKATGLHTLREDILEIHSSITTTKETLQSHEEHLELEKERLQVIRDEYERLLRLGTLQNSINLLKVKALWRVALEKEAVLSQAQAEEKARTAELETMRSNEENHSTRAAELEEEIREATARVEELAAESNEIANVIEEKKGEQYRKERDVNAFKQRALQHRQQKRSLEERRNNVLRDIAAAKDTARARANDEHVRRLMMEEKQCEGLCEELQLRKESLQQDRHNLDDMKRESENKLRAIEQTARRLGAELEQERAQLGRADSDGMSRVALLGRWIVDATRAVAAARNRGEFRGEVFGPLGAMITIREGYADYAAQLERAIGPMLSTFVVSNGEDRDRVMSLTRGVNASITVITQPACVRYPVSIQMPHERPPFILAIEALHIQHDLLFNCLIDQCAIHRVALGRRSVLPDLIERYQGRQQFRWNLQAFIDERGSLIRLINGNKSDEANRFPTRNILIADSASARKRLQQDVQDKEAQHRKYMEDLTEIRRMLDGHKRDVNECDSQLAKCENELKAQRQQLRRLQYQLQEQQATVDPDMTAMEAEKHDLEVEIDRMNAAIEQCELDQGRAKGVLEAFLKEINSVKEQQRQCEERLQEVGRQLQDLYTQEMRLKKASADRQRTASLLEEKAKRAQQAAQQAQEDYLEHLESAEEQTRQHMGPDWDGQPLQLAAGETLKSLESERKRQEAELAQARRDISQRSETLEQAKEHLDNASSEYRKAVDRAQNVKDSLKLLEDSEAERRRGWRRALKESAEKTAKNFDFYVASKYSKGRIVFDHEGSEMKVLYQVDADDQTTACNDVRNLSGGERSYVTFSLLLALGHVIESPFRLMDEYDVFMDEPTRKLTLELLKAYSCMPNQCQRQFIILTPHSLGNLSTGDRVHVSRMPEPVRLSAHGLQQQTLD